MCGFACILAKDPRGAPGGERLRRMAAPLAHRGPDDAGLEVIGRAGLAFRRLSIIDLSPKGHQPMADGTGRYRIVFNGEIYNFPELAGRLAGRGSSFRSRTDTEVVLEAYKAWGAACVHEFNGMWAFLIYDAEEDTLFCSRDRFGVKPLYVCETEREILLGSEIKALLAGGIRPEEEPARVFELVALGYADTGAGTLFRGIRQVPPGHSLLIGRDRVLRETAYWSPPPETDHPPSFEEASTRFRELFLDAVRLRLRADVPVAALLSGGQDSSAIVCGVEALRRGGLQGLEALKTERFVTFTACYEDPALDERHWVEEVVRHCTVESRLVFPGAPDLLEDLKRIILHNDEPLQNSNHFAHWMLMKDVAAQGFRVVLSGQGADEVLAGYDRHVLGPRVLDLLAGGRFAAAIGELSGARRAYGFPHSHALLRCLQELVPRPARALLKSAAGERIHKVFALSHIWRHRRAFIPSPRKGSRLRSTLLGALTRHSLPRILHGEDRTSMAFSVEQRFPFLDYRIVEFCFSLPDSYKMDGGLTKRLLRAAAAPLLPGKIVGRTGKIGFATPTAAWVGDMLETEYIRDLLARENIPGTGRRALRGLGSAGEPRGRGEAQFLWRFLNYLVWRDVFGVGGEGWSGWIR
ncbi:MAG: asparagine synthase (glutamine-hydrolyzing) [Bacteroidota bacterium]